MQPESTGQRPSTHGWRRATRLSLSHVHHFTPSLGGGAGELSQGSDARRAAAVAVAMAAGRNVFMGRFYESGRE